ncbi:MAG: ATP synthase F0 subunit B [Blastocatellia bacterium]|nr:ATP synthase F0 subunit B [Blastocatellia bacterium]
MSMSNLNRIAFSLPALLLSGGGGVHPAIAKAFNLALFLGVMYLLVRKPARQFFADRFALVRATLEHAAREKAAAEAKITALESRLNRLDDELKKIKSEAESEAVAERARIENETTQDLEKIRVSARREIESAKQVALTDLREFAATKAVDLAEELIRREMKPDDDAKMLKRMAEEMSNVR